jgi:ADP-heptose:LPS heptosyltransferase
VTLLCGPRGRAAAELLPGVDGVVEFEAPWIDPDPRPVRPDEVAAVVDRLAGLRPDEAVVFTSFHQSPLPTALMLRLAGVPRVSAISEDYPGSLLDVRHRADPEIHEVERALSLAEAAGFRPAPEDDGRLAILALPGTELAPPEPYVVVHPGASVPARAWPAALARSVVRRLDRMGYVVCVTGSPSERELTASVTRRTRALDLGGRTALPTLASLLRGASAVICGNTGPAHLAAAVGTPVVSIFAPTVPASNWRPWGVPFTLLGDQAIGCAGCRARNCPLPDHPCVGRISVDEVLGAMTKLLSHRPQVCASPAAELNEA